MSDYAKYNIASDPSEIIENYTKLDQNLNKSDNKPQYYKLGIRPYCVKPVYNHQLGFTGYKGDVCGYGYVDGEEENKKSPNCKEYPWYCNN